MNLKDFTCAPGKGQTIYWDGKQPGLGLRATAAGARSYIFEATLKAIKQEGAPTAPKGKTIRITIGDTQTYTVPAAQRIAAGYKAQTDKGIDPLQVEADQLAAAQADRDAKAAAVAAALSEQARQNLTLAEVWPIYIAARRHKWSAGHLQNHFTLTAAGGEPKKRGKGVTVAGPMAPLMPLALADLTAERIATWLEKEAVERPTNAAQSYRLLRAFIPLGCRRSSLSRHHHIRNVQCQERLRTRNSCRNLAEILEISGSAAGRVTLYSGQYQFSLRNFKSI